MKLIEHTLKIRPNDASMHLRGIKPWELRKNDRNYQEGDFITFVVQDVGKPPTGMRYRRKIINVSDIHVGLRKGYCIITISNIVYDLL